jgi:hypothetical protein
MKTAIGYPPVYFTVYLKKPSQSSPSAPYFKVIGAYSDVRDAIQAIVTAYRRCHDRSISFGIESSTARPRHWLHPTRYRDELRG